MNRETHTQKKIREFLDGRGELALIDIAQGLNCNPGTIKNALKRLITRGSVGVIIQDLTGSNVFNYRIRKKYYVKK